MKLWLVLGSGVVWMWAMWMVNMSPWGVGAVLALIVLHCLSQYGLHLWEKRSKEIVEQTTYLEEERQAQQREQEDFEEELLILRERERHVDAIIRASARGSLSELNARLDAHPGARVVQHTHDEMTVEVPVQQPDWSPVKIDVELKNEWEETDLPPQTQWERLLAED